MTEEHYINLLINSEKIKRGIKICRSCAHWGRTIRTEDGYEFGCRLDLQLKDCQGPYPYEVDE